MPVTKHTPGPWIPARKANCTSCRHPAILRDGGQVATATWQGSEAETDANACLIAAAPDLLHACREAALVLAALSETCPPLIREYEIVSAAIAKAAKATGGTPCL